MSRYKVKSVTMSFAGTDYEVPQAPAGKPQACDPTDVTCLSDTEKKFLPGAVLNNDTIEVVVQGIKISSAPTINTIGALTFSVTYDDGAATPSPETVDCGDCILTNIAPPNPEAGGDRAGNWTLTFQPGSAAAAANSSSTPATT